ncbi:hypothetical protein ACFQUU_21090 [Herbaspirillum sp. GCM10030257]|uniref:hypothetical protein n=1 Tax=Herbaspirillum sp. GCM10030257 TaxID=3273393 RepID=UPI003621B18D
MINPTPDTLELGAVYKPDWDERLIRVIAFDNNVVMYDVWWPGVEGWGLGKLTGKVAYYRISTQLLLARASYVRTDEYSELEFKTNRPDLPFSFSQSTALNWYDQVPENIERLAHIFEVCGEGAGAACAPCLGTAQVYVSPFGPKGSSKPAILIKADDGNAFTVAELLWNAWQLQLPNLRETRLTDGVGLYRLGLQKQIPSYYIWGAKSRLEEASSNAT